MIVNETGVAPAPAANEVGLKTQAEVESGSPEQLNVTAAANVEAPDGVAVKV
jgi:hypothetical protein